MSAVYAHRRTSRYAHLAATSAVIIVFAFTEWLSAKYISEHSRLAGTLIEITIAVAAALAFAPLHHHIDAAIESAFTRRRRQTIEALHAFRSELASFNDTAQLLRRVVDAIGHHCRAHACAVYIKREHYRAEASSFDVPAVEVDPDDPLVVRLRSTGTPASPQALQSPAPGTIAFPMTVAGELVGFVCVAAPGAFERDVDDALVLLSESLAMALNALEPMLRASGVAVPNNLPAGLPPLIGRGEEIAEIRDLLTQARLITLTGTGGVGKTRLALHVASEMRANPGGLWFVDLAALDDASLVPAAIAAVFAVPDDGGERSLIDKVCAHLHDRTLLIVLDNCEHVIAEAALAAARLLERCPYVQVLATSREPLGIPSEEPYRVPSLPVPPRGKALSAEDAMSYPAVALFAARARSANRSCELNDANVDLVAEIVRRLDGIAMAIELAAPRVKVLSLEQLCARLNERFELLTGGARTALPRHQTLRALIGWSYELLDENEKALLRRCAVFRGDWSLEAAEAVFNARDAVGEWRTIDVLEALVDKSLVSAQAGPAGPRYRLLETTRAFALERLAGDERNDTFVRYSRYYAQLAQRTGAHYWRDDFDAWMDSVREELENYRGGIASGLRPGGDPDAAASIVAHLRWYWNAAARREGSALTERAIAVCAQHASPACGLLSLCAALLDTSANALSSARTAADALHPDAATPPYAEACALVGIALGRAGRVQEAREPLGRALDLARATGENRLIGWVLSMVAYWLGASGETSRARELFDEAAVIVGACADPWQLARLHVHRAEFLFKQRDVEGALASARAAERAFRSRNADTGLCVALLNASAYLLAMDRFEEAWDAAREGLELALRLDNAMARAWAVGHLAEVAAANGDASRAARLLGHADAIYAKTGTAREPTEQRGYDRTLLLISGALPQHEMSGLFMAGSVEAIEAIARDAQAIARPRARERVGH